MFISHFFASQTYWSFTSDNLRVIHIKIPYTNINNFRNLKVYSQIKFTRCFFLLKLIFLSLSAYQLTLNHIIFFHFFFWFDFLLFSCIILNIFKSYLKPYDKFQSIKRNMTLYLCLIQSKQIDTDASKFCIFLVSVSSCIIEIWDS